MIADNIKGVPKDMIHVSYTFGLNKWETLVRVITPYAAPGMVDTLRITLGWAWTYLVVADLVADLSLEVRTGELVTIVGTSGCGKSTFLRLVAGLVEPSSGLIEVDGQPVRGPGPDRGMVFQAYTLFPWLNALDNVKFGLKKQRQNKKEQNEIAHHYLNLVGLSGFARAYPAQLSGGMKQRVAIARALAYNPAIL